MLATWDVIGLFTIIPQEEGIDYTRDALNKSTNPEVPTEFLIRLLEVVFKDSIFQFSDKYYKQNVGTSMGTNPAPLFANLFMAKIGNKILALLENLNLTENSYTHQWNSRCSTPLQIKKLLKIIVIV